MKKIVVLVTAILLYSCADNSTNPKDEIPGWAAGDEGAIVITKIGGLYLHFL